MVASVADVSVVMSAVASVVAVVSVVSAGSVVVTSLLPQETSNISIAIMKAIKEVTFFMVKKSFHNRFVLIKLLYNENVKKSTLVGESTQFQQNYQIVYFHFELYLTKKSYDIGVVFLRTQRQLYSPAASYIASQLYSSCDEWYSLRELIGE